MAKATLNFTLPAKEVYTFPHGQSNQITEEYYNFLIGEINRGVIQKAVLKVTYTEYHKDVRYYLISER